MIPLPRYLLYGLRPGSVGRFALTPGPKDPMRFALDEVASLTLYFDSAPQDAAWVQIWPEFVSGHHFAYLGSLAPNIGKKLPRRAYFELLTALASDMARTCLREVPAYVRVSCRTPMPAYGATLC